MLFYLLVLLVGLGLLVKASDSLIESAGRLARILGVSELIVGLTIVAIGTSIPELASSVLASLHGSGDLVIGNVIGSNVANIGFVLAISLLFAPLAIDKQVMKRDALFLLFASLALVFVLFGNVVSRLEGIFLLLLFIAYFTFLFRTKKYYREQYGFPDFLNYFLRSEYLRELTESSAAIISDMGQKIVVDKRVLRELLLVFAYSIGVIVGAELLVTSALKLSSTFNINASFIGITIIAMGTSLPELSVSISAIKRNKGGILIGNIIGSGITNIFLVVGLSAIVSELSIASILFRTALIALAFIIFFIVMLFYKKSLDRLDAFVLLALYAIFIAQAYG